MRYRRAGKTDLMLSEVGFGTAAPSGLMTVELPDAQYDVTKRALELGINYFDCAPDYGDGIGELTTGQVLKRLGVRPIITTKVEIRESDLPDIAGHIERSLDASLERLGVDYVDVLQIHNGPTGGAPNFQDQSYQRLNIKDYFAPKGAIEGLQRVQRQGKTRYLGFICRGGDGPFTKQLVDTGVFDLINVSFTLLNPSAGFGLPYGMNIEADYANIISYAESRGVGTAIYSPLAGGLLADAVVQRGEFHPLARGLIDRQRPLLSRARALNFLSIAGKHSLAQAAFRFILANTGVSTVIGGFSDVPQLEELVATSGAGPIDEELMARIEMVWRVGGTNAT